MIEYLRVKLYARCRFKKFMVTPAVYTSYYTEEGLHRPLFTDPLHLYLADDDELIYNSSSAALSPRKGYEFSEIEVPVDYNQINGLSSSGKVPRFIALETRLETGKSIDIYGWIDDIEPVAVKGPSANCRIRWHVDYWLTEENFRQYYNYYTLTGTRTPIQYGQGTVKRGPESMKRPDPSEPRKWIYDSESKIGLSNKGPYAILLRTKTSGGVTTIKLDFWDLTNAIIDSGNTYDIPGIKDIYNGLTEEMLGLDPDSIIGVWFSPIAPALNNPSDIQTHVYGANTYAWYEKDWGHNTAMIYTTNTFFSNSTIKTDDDAKYLVCDPNYVIFGTLPWGIETDHVTSRLDISTSGASIFLEFTITIGGQNVHQRAMGMEIQMPLIAAPITSNALSSYVYSGQQEYDKQMAFIQQQQNLKSGVANSGNSAMGGLIGGAMAGGPIGAAVGAVAGFALGTAGAFVNQTIQQEADAKSQAATEKLLSNQAANVIAPGGGPGWYQNGTGNWKIVKLVRDSQSASELSDDQTERGFITDAWVSDCSSLIATGGPLRIEGLEVKGDINARGRREISALFARGVHIDIIT